MTTVGFLGGKFLIPHRGHEWAILQASTQVDELHVIVVHDEEFERKTYWQNSSLSPVSAEQRVRWLRQMTFDLPHVQVHSVHQPEEAPGGSQSASKNTDTSLGTEAQSRPAERLTGSPQRLSERESWTLGAQRIKQAIGKHIDVVFSSEPSYGDIFNELYPEARHVVLDADRKRFPISGTKIREEGVIAHWDMVPQVVRQDYVKRVVIMGTESTGKSTLVRNLAALYDTEYVAEYGRTYYENMGHYETQVTDFRKIAVQHASDIESAVKRANKVLIVDTEAHVTANFLSMYHPESEPDPVVEAIASSQHFDAVIMLSTDVEWIQDGTRAFGEHQQRLEAYAALKRRLQEEGVNFVEVEGNYHDRLNQSIVVIDEVLDN